MKKTFMTKLELLEEIRACADTFLWGPETNSYFEALIDELLSGGKRTPRQILTALSNQERLKKIEEELARLNKEKEELARLQ
jgi:hypothetical protein